MPRTENIIDIANRIVEQEKAKKMAKKEEFVNTAIKFLTKKDVPENQRIDDFFDFVKTTLKTTEEPEEKRNLLKSIKNELAILWAEGGPEGEFYEKIKQEIERLERKNIALTQEELDLLFYQKCKHLTQLFNASFDKKSNSFKNFQKMADDYINILIKQNGREFTIGVLQKLFITYVEISQKDKKMAKSLAPIIKYLKNKCQKLY